MKECIHYCDKCCYEHGYCAAFDKPIEDPGTCNHECAEFDIDPDMEDWGMKFCDWYGNGGWRVVSAVAHIVWLAAVAAILIANCLIKH